jgi:hypothetical protein
MFCCVMIYRVIQPMVIHVVNNLVLKQTVFLFDFLSVYLKLKSLKLLNKTFFGSILLPLAATL